MNSLLRPFQIAGAALALLLLANLFACTPVQAQVLEVPNTPRATVQGKIVGVWAFDSGWLGLCATVAVKEGSNAWQYPTAAICQDGGQIVNYPGGPAGWIEYVRPDINARLTGIFGAPPVPGSGSQAPPTTNLGLLNGAFGTAFKLVTDGTTVSLVPK